MIHPRGSFDLEFLVADAQGPAREQAWSGTAHALVAELGVGAVTHSTLQLGLGIAGLLAGLGVITIAMGGTFIYMERPRSKKD